MNTCKFCNNQAIYYLHILKNGKKLSSALAQVCEIHTELNIDDSESLIAQFMSSNENWFENVKELRYIALTESQERKINILKGK